MARNRALVQFKCLSGCKAALSPAREAGGAVFGLKSSPEGRSLWGKPGLGGFEPARGEAPIEAAAWCVKELKELDLKLNR